MDNLFVERLWKSATYEEVYLKAHESVSAAHTGLARYHFTFYNPAAFTRVLIGRRWIRSPSPGCPCPGEPKLCLNCAARLHLSQRAVLFRQTEPPLHSGFHWPFTGLSTRPSARSRPRSKRLGVVGGLDVVEVGADLPVGDSFSLEPALGIQGAADVSEQHRVQIVAEEIV